MSGINGGGDQTARIAMLEAQVAELTRLFNLHHHNAGAGTTATANGFELKA